MRRLRLVTFDLDDTLWDAAPVLQAAEAAQRAWLEAHRPRTAPWLEPERFNAFKRRIWQEHPTLRHDMSALRQRILFALQREAGYAEAAASQGAHAAFAVFYEHRQRVNLFPQSVPVLAELARSYRLVALTNGNAEVSRTGVGAYFECALRAEDVGAGKPDPALFVAALERTGVSAEEAVHIGDSVEHDVAGARNAGLGSVWFNPRGREPASATAPRPDAEIRCLSELPATLARLEQRRHG